MGEKHPETEAQDRNLKHRMGLGISKDLHEICFDQNKGWVGEIQLETSVLSQFWKGLNAN